MAPRKVIKSVLAGFLGTYVSRNSDFSGYWLFGFLVAEYDQFRVDLLHPAQSRPETPIGYATSSAAAKFVEQLQKAGLSRLQISDASLTIWRSREMVKDSVNGHPCTGFNVCFRAEATVDDGRHFERKEVVFVAPHDPTIEFQSGRTTEPDPADHEEHAD